MATKKRKYDSVELANKFVLTFDESLQYFQIGERRLRRLMAENEGASWLLWVGNRHYIKRPLFEKYLESVEHL